MLGTWELSIVQFSIYRHCALHEFNSHGTSTTTHIYCQLIVIALEVTFFSLFNDLNIQWCFHINVLAWTMDHVQI